MDGGAWKAAVHGVAEGRTWLSDFTFTFHFHALEKEMATHSSILAWRIPGKGEPGGLPSMGSHRVGHNWSDLAAAAATTLWCFFLKPEKDQSSILNEKWKLSWMSSLQESRPSLFWVSRAQNQWPAHPALNYNNFSVSTLLKALFELLKQFKEENITRRGLKFRYRYIILLFRSLVSINKCNFVGSFFWPKSAS